MTIRRDDLDAGRIDLSDVANSAGERLPRCGRSTF